MGINTDLFDLTGQVALLTGASKGMGKSMAMALAEHGSKVVVSSRKLDQCEETAKRLTMLVERSGRSPSRVTLDTRNSFSHWSTKLKSV